MKNKNNKELANLLSEKISTPIYDCLVELYNADAERRNNGEIAPADTIKTRQEIVSGNIEDLFEVINALKEYHENNE